MEFLTLARLRKLGQPGHHQGGQQYVQFPCTSCCISVLDTFFRNDADPVRPSLCACTIASTVPYNEKRDSVKLLSQNWYKAGTVFIMDAVQYVFLSSLPDHFAFIFLHLFQGHIVGLIMNFCFVCVVPFSLPRSRRFVLFVCGFIYGFGDTACRLDVVSGQVSPPFPPPTQLNLK